MGIYAVTGAASGIGAAVAKKLQSLGHQIITVDLRGAEVNVDLGVAEGRRVAINAIAQLAPAGLDGLVTCAGVSTHAPLTLIPRVNYFGTVDLIEGLQSHLQKKRGSVVLISSNSSTMQTYDQNYTNALLDHNEELACTLIADLDGQTAYAGSKFAIVVWMRRNNMAYAQVGIRLNAVAPGYTETNMTKEGVNDPVYGASIVAFRDSIPIGRAGRAEDQANAVSFLLSEQASFISGVVLFVDGGHDALFRNDRF